MTYVLKLSHPSLPPYFLRRPRPLSNALARGQVQGVYLVTVGHRRLDIAMEAMNHFYFDEREREIYIYIYIDLFNHIYHIIIYIYILPTDLLKFRFFCSVGLPEGTKSQSGNEKHSRTGFPRIMIPIKIHWAYSRTSHQATIIYQVNIPLYH